MKHWNIFVLSNFKYSVSPMKAGFYFLQAFHLYCVWNMKYFICIHLCLQNFMKKPNKQNKVAPIW